MKPLSLCSKTILLNLQDLLRSGQSLFSWTITSHISVPAIRLAKENGVVLVTLHPHTSNKMQPLDKSVFGPSANENMMAPGYVGNL